MGNLLGQKIAIPAGIGPNSYEIFRSETVILYKNNYIQSTAKK